MKWAKLAPQVCGGRAAERWAKKACNKADGATKRAEGKKHHVVESSPILWCSACGAYGETAPKLLTQQCRGDPRGKPELRGMADQLRQLVKGKHPKTGTLLGPRPRCRTWHPAVTAGVQDCSLTRGPT